ncbi:MAG: BatD family protein [Verrucomicrobiota bacterium]
MSFPRFLSCLSVACLWAAAGQAQAQQPRVLVDLDPKEVGLGNASRLIIQVENGRDSRVFLPQVADLVLDYLGQSASSQRISVINGQMTYQSTQQKIYSVIPYREGEFTIPPFEIDVDGQTFKTPELKLMVRPGKAPAPVTQTPNPTPRARALSPGGRLNLPGAPSTSQVQPPSIPSSPTRSRQEVSFLEMEIPKREVYVGEMIPVRLVWYVKRGVQHPPTFPNLPSQAFVSNLAEAQPTRRQEYIGNELYEANVWEFAMTAVKEGEYEVDAQIETVLTVPVGSASRNPFSGFGSRFHNRVRRYEKTLETVPQKVTIKPLPEEGRPASFDGAVGEYNLTAKGSPRQVDYGEPITLTTTVQGIGDLSRVNAPEMVDDEGWRIYPAKSEVELEPGIGNRGKKVFEQAIIPRNPALKLIPPIEFSYFNPNTSQYVTRRIHGPPVEIIGSPDAVTQLPPTPQPQAGEGETELTAAEADSPLVPNKTALGGFTRSFTRVALQPWFLATQGVPLLALLIGGVVISRQRRLETDPAFARRLRLEKEYQDAVQKMSAAVAASDEPAFFSSTRRALQHRLALDTALEPTDVTPEKIAEHAPQSSAAAAEIFAQADATVYGSGASTRPLSEWHDLSQTTLTLMEREARQPVEEPV